MTIKLTLAIVTGRAEPMIDRMLESLAPQVGIGDDVQILIVDMLGRTPDDLGVRPNYGHWEPQARVVLPKPTIWQGASRVTSCDWWALSNSRNTALVLCETDYIAFCDDRAIMGDRWLDTVRVGARDGRIIAGSYDKLEDDESNNGKGSGRKKTTPDHRRAHSPHGMRGCGGGWFYGCTFALPLAAALAVGGHEEGCDGLSGEDYTFGLMLGNAGYRIDFEPAMFVLLERPVSSAHSVKRSDKGLSPNDKSHAALATFGKAKRADRRFTPDLHELRARVRAGERLCDMQPAWAHRNADGEPIDWYDGQPIKEL